MSKFQIIFTGIFGVFVVIGVIVFASYRGSSDSQTSVVVWGSIPNYEFMDVVDRTSLKESKLYSVEYVEKNEDTFDEEFVEALASGKGPDLFIISSEKLIKHSNKIVNIPYSVLSQRQFRNSFIEGAEIFTNTEGILALPIGVDPLIMYWNRSIFNQSLITNPPRYWDEFYDLASKISKKDGALNIQKSAVAMGEFANINNAKELVSSLVMQGGNSIVVSGYEGKLETVFDYGKDGAVAPAYSALNFYTEFSNPVKSSYSWNRSLPSSRDYFLSGNLGMYFGFGSDISKLQIQNPNLNFDVAVLPFSREQEPVNYGKFYALAITRSSQKINPAFSVANILSTEGAKYFSEILNIAPVRRDLLSEKQTDAYRSVFYEGAIRSRAWLDPDPEKTNVIFKNMIESITSGRSRISEAISRASKEIELLTKK